jgi:glycosyltransferase involved in cell wall biosynthesis
MRYIIDVTQLVHWPGHLTGIPRVMDELALRFLSDETNEVLFVSWVKEKRAMCTLNFGTTRSLRGSHIDFIKNGKSDTPRVVEASSSHQSPTILSSAKRFTKKAVKKVAAKSRIDRTIFYQRIKTARRSIELQSYTEYTPLSGDKFFIPWGEWWDKNWLDLIVDFSTKKVDIYPICHDILPMIVPHFSGNSASLENFVRQVFPISKSIITPSESTKNDLASWMNHEKLTVPPIRTFRLGEDFSFKKSNLDSKEMSKKYAVQKDNFIIYVSTIEPRKNHSILYYTYKLAAERGIKLPRLLIVGRVGHDTSQIIQLLKTDNDVNSLISIENNVDDSDLNWLYQNCRFTIMPSFYEGWGMSVIESISRGKPAVVSNTSSLLEMPDDCVIRFNPASTDECLAAIQEMSKPATLKRYREAANAYKTHSWDDSYQQILHILEEK